MVGLRGIVRSGLQSCLGIALVLAMVGRASANLIVTPPSSAAFSVANGIYELFLVNLPVDMLLFSALFLLVLWAFKAPMWASPKGPNKLIALVVLGGLAVAVTGALVDFYCLYAEPEHAAGSYYLDLSLENIALAGAGVFASVYAVSLAVTRLRLIPSLVPASVITLLNVAAWTLMDEDTYLVSNDVFALLAFVVFLFVPPVMFGIAHLHGKKGVRS